MTPPRVPTPNTYLNPRRHIDGPTKGIYIVTNHVYRVRITAYPHGACVLTQPFLPCSDKWYWMPVAGWEPPGWTPSPRYRNTVGGHRFSWPNTNTVFHTRAAAVRRARLIESFGASVVIYQSEEITWPSTPHMIGSRSTVIEVLA